MFNLISRVCPTCKVEYALPVAFYEGAKLSGADWFCPNGHKLHFPRKAQEPDKLPPLLAIQFNRLEAQRDALTARVKALEADCACALELAEAESAERQKLAHRLNAARNRAKHVRRENQGGTCPWCHNRFDNLRRHLAAKHQGFIEAQRSIA